MTPAMKKKIKLTSAAAMAAICCLEGMQDVATATSGRPERTKYDGMVFSISRKVLGDIEKLYGRSGFEGVKKLPLYEHEAIVLEVALTNFTGYLIESPLIQQGHRAALAATNALLVGHSA